MLLLACWMQLLMPSHRSCFCVLMVSGWNCWTIAEICLGLTMGASIHLSNGSRLWTTMLCLWVTADGRRGKGCPCHFGSYWLHEKMHSFLLLDAWLASWYSWVTRSSFGFQMVTLNCPSRWAMSLIDRVTSLQQKNAWHFNSKSSLPWLDAFKVCLRGYNVALLLRLVSP